MFVLALDQGTTSSRAILFDQEGKVVYKAQKEFSLVFPKAGYVELDSNIIWDTQISVAKKVLFDAKVDLEDIACIGIANQRETTIVWDKKSGRQIHNAIIWQCARTAGICEQLKKEGLEDYIKTSTGLVIDSYFSVTKLKWILDNVNGARMLAEAGDLLFGTVDSYLLWRLTGGIVHATDYSNASRTMAFNINTLRWDEKILSALDIPLKMMPEVRLSSGSFGFTIKEHFGKEIPIMGVAGDQQAALFGQTCFEKGDCKNTYGTGCFMLMNTGEEPVSSDNGLLSTIAWAFENNGKKKICYALEGSIFNAGAAVQWLRDNLKIIEKSEQSESLALSVDSNNGVYMVPAFSGLGAPYWDMYARGILIGLTRDTLPAHIARSTLESIAYQTKDVIEAMQQDSGITLTDLRVDGGATINNFLMQFQSDILGAKVLRPEVTESTARGAAFLAGLASGVWTDLEQIKSLSKIDKTFLPGVSNKQAKYLYNKWLKAVERTRRWEDICVE